MLNLKFALAETDGESPQEEPITNTKSFTPDIFISLIFEAKSSEDNCLP